MSIELITVLMFGSLILGLIVGLPLAFVLGGIAVIFTYFLWGAGGLNMIVFQAFGWATNPLIIAVPLFVFMGIVLERSGLAERLFEMIYRWSGNLRGGLAIGTIIICTIFAAMTGVTGAATVTMGIIALPAMLNRKYHKGIAIGAIASGGTLGILIPPSVLMIIFSLITGSSIGKLFAGGIMSGLVLSALLIIYVGLRSYLQPNLAPANPEKYTWGQKFNSLAAVIAPVFLIVAVLGSIFAGIATPTESAAVGAFGAIVCAAAYRRLNWKLIKDTCYGTIKLSVMVVWICLGAAVFVSIYTGVGATDFIRDLIIGFEVNRWFIIAGMMLTLFILGMFLDPGGIILLTAPIFTPIATGMGFDITWFGVLYIVNMQMGYVTPPFGFNLFYLRSVCPQEVSMGDIYKSVLPYLLVMILGMILIMIFPQLATWLPSVIVK